MRIGIFGGTFDPPHLGHLDFARAALEHLQLDEVLFLPAYRNPLKRTKASPPKQRLEMVRQAIAKEPKMSVSDIEISRGGKSYMVETLMELQMVKPADYWLLLGADALKGFGQWKGPEKIIKLARLGVALRPPTTEGELMIHLPQSVQDRTDIVPMKPIPISSTDLRDRIARHSDTLGKFLPPGVLQYIKQNHLYGS